METRSAARKRRALEASAETPDGKSKAGPSGAKSAGDSEAWVEPSGGKVKALEACAERSAGPDGRATADPAAGESEEWALAGRLLELDNPVLLRIAREADLRTLVALERTSRRLSVLSKEAGDYGAIRQLTFTMKVEWADRVQSGLVQVQMDLVLRASPEMKALGHRGFWLRLSKEAFDKGAGTEAHRKRLDGLLEHLLSRGARPSSLRVGDESRSSSTRSCGYDFVNPSLSRLAEDSRLSALQSVLLDDAMPSYEGNSRTIYIACNHEKIFAKQLPQLLGLFCPLPDCFRSTDKYPSLLYACLGRVFWNGEEAAEFLKRLRCLVLKRTLTAEEAAGARARAKERVERLSGGRLQLRIASRSEPPEGCPPYIGRNLHYDIGPLVRLRMGFACEDFDPAELRPLHLARIWDEALSNE